MKKGWETKELAAVSAINYGYTESASSQPVGPRFLRITDIQDDGVDWHSVPYCKIEMADLPKYRLASGDIVFARTGATTGKSFLVNEPPDAVFASYLIRLRLLDKKLLPEFVLLFFQTAGYWQSIKDGSSGSAQGGFNATKLGALSIPVPPMAEQQRIVGLLDEAFEGIANAKANAEKNLQNARALFESHLQSVFIQRDPLALLSDLADEVTDGDHSPPPKAPTGVPFITISDIDKRTGTIDFRDTFTVPETYFRSLKPSKKPRVGDVLYTVTGATLGIPILIREQRDFCFQRHIGLIRPNANTDSSWLTYALRSPQVFRQATIGSTGAAQKTVSLGVLRNLQLPKVKLAEQKQIAAKLDDLREETQRLACLYERKLAALDALKKSLLHRAFTGEL